MMILELTEGSRHSEKIGTKFIISIVFDPAADALFIQPYGAGQVGESPPLSGKRMIFMRK